MSSKLHKGKVFIRISLILPHFSNQVVEWCTLLKITATWFIAKFTSSPSSSRKVQLQKSEDKRTALVCFTSLDLLLIMLKIDYCLFILHLDR